MTDDSDAPGPEIRSIPQRSRRRERVDSIRAVQTIVPAVALLFTGAQSLLGQAHGLALSLALLEVAFGALLLRSLLQVRAELAAELGGANRISILAAAVLAVAVLERWHSTGHFAWLTALMAVVTLILGLGSGRLAAIRQRRSPRVGRSEAEPPGVAGLTPVLGAGTLQTEGESK
ncbi:MAG: hypothetical protein ABI609_06010 [Acidobacteriota bacterium]